MYPKITLVNSQEFRTLDLQIKGRHLKKKQKKKHGLFGFFLFCILHRNPSMYYNIFVLRILHVPVYCDYIVKYSPIKM